MKLVDTHCHIYATEFDADREAMLRRAETEGITDLLMPAIDSTTHTAMLDLEKNHPICRAMMGVHPCSVKENYEEELRTAEKHFRERPFVAVGETGLDFYWDKTYTKEQYEVFQQQIDWALEFNIPVVVHSRESLDECINVIKQNQKGKLKGVFHCFSGTVEQAKKIIDLGFYLGIGGVLTFKNSGVDKVVKEISLEHIVLETDAPYLTPVPFRGKRNEPAYLKYVVDTISGIYLTGPEQIASITSLNAEKLFSL